MLFYYGMVVPRAEDIDSCTCVVERAMNVAHAGNGIQSRTSVVLLKEDTYHGVHIFTFAVVVLSSSFRRLHARGYGALVSPLVDQELYKNRFVSCCTRVFLFSLEAVIICFPHSVPLSY